MSDYHAAMLHNIFCASENGSECGTTKRSLADELRKSQDGSGSEDCVLRIHKPPLAIIKTTSIEVLREGGERDGHGDVDVDRDIEKGFVSMSRNIGRLE